MTYPYSAATAYPPVSADSVFPLYGANFLQAISRAFAYLFKFSGQAARSEFWWGMLFFAVLRLLSYLQFMVVGVAGALGESAGAVYGELLYLPALFVLLSFFGLDIVLLVPTLSLGWRRLRDAGFAGGLTFLSLVPIAGLIVFVLASMPSTSQAPAPPVSPFPTAA